MKRHVLSETTRFVQNDAVSCFLKKKKAKQCRLGDTVPLSSSPGRAAGEDRNCCISHLFPPRMLLPKLKTPYTPPHDEKLGEPRPPANPALPCSSCTTIKSPRSLGPINRDSTPARNGGKKKKKGKEEKRKKRTKRKGIEKKGKKMGKAVNRGEREIKERDCEG